MFLSGRYQKYSITVSAVEKIPKTIKRYAMLLKDLSPNKIKTIASDFCFKSY